MRAHSRLALRASRVSRSATSCKEQACSINAALNQYASQAQEAFSIRTFARTKSLCLSLRRDSSIRSSFPAACAKSAGGTRTQAHQGREPRSRSRAVTHPLQLTHAAAHPQGGWHPGEPTWLPGTAQAGQLAQVQPDWSALLPCLSSVTCLRTCSQAKHLHWLA